MLSTLLLAAFNNVSACLLCCSRSSLHTLDRSETRKSEKKEYQTYPKHTSAVCSQHLVLTSLSDLHLLLADLHLLLEDALVPSTNKSYHRHHHESRKWTQESLGSANHRRNRSSRSFGHPTKTAMGHPTPPIVLLPCHVISSDQIAACIPPSLNRQTTSMFMKKPTAKETTKSAGSSGGLTTRDAGLDLNRMGALQMTFLSEWVCKSRSVETRGRLKLWRMEIEYVTQV